MMLASCSTSWQSIPEFQRLPMTSLADEGHHSSRNGPDRIQ